MYNQVGTLETFICEECESIDGLTSHIVPNEEDEPRCIEYHCRDCKAKWVEYV